MPEWHDSNRNFEYGSDNPERGSRLADVECGGRQIHDANVIATMLVHGIGAVVTMNLDDFARSGGYVDVVRL